MKYTVKEMNTKELENVSGGTIGECCDDSRFLVDIGALGSEVGGWDATAHWNTSSKIVDDAWKALGIRCVSKPLKDTRYYINGKEISRNDAIKAAASAAGFTGRLNNYFN